jgi:hypothetical protein
VALLPSVLPKLVSKLTASVTLAPYGRLSQFWFPRLAFSVTVKLAGTSAPAITQSTLADTPTYMPPPGLASGVRAKSEPKNELVEEE